MPPRFTYWVALFLLLTGCAVFPPDPAGISLPAQVTDFAFEGRFSFRHEDKNYYGRLSWQHTSTTDSILLSSSFGQGMAQIVVGENSARLLLADGKVHEADNAEALTFRLLGYPLSIRQLADWVRGKNGINANEDTDMDSSGRLRRLRREGWIVDYAYDNEDSSAFPARIIALRTDEGVELRLKIDEWQNASPETPEKLPE